MLAARQQETVSINPAATELAGGREGCAGSWQKGRGEHKQLRLAAAKSARAGAGAASLTFTRLSARWTRCRPVAPSAQCHRTQTLHTHSKHAHLDEIVQEADRVLHVGLAVSAQPEHRVKGLRRGQGLVSLRPQKLRAEWRGQGLVAFKAVADRSGAVQSGQGLWQCTWTPLGLETPQLQDCSCRIAECTSEKKQTKPSRATLAMLYSDSHA